MGHTEVLEVLKRFRRGEEERLWLVKVARFGRGLDPRIVLEVLLLVQPCITRSIDDLPT